MISDELSGYSLIHQEKRQLPLSSEEQNLISKDIYLKNDFQSESNLQDFGQGLSLYDSKTDFQFRGVEGGIEGRGSYISVMK